MIGFIHWWGIYLGMITLWTGVDTSQSREVKFSDSKQTRIAEAREEHNEQTKRAA